MGVWTIGDGDAEGRRNYWIADMLLDLCTPPLHPSPEMGGEWLRMDERDHTSIRILAEGRCSPTLPPSPEMGGEWLRMDDRVYESSFFYSCC